MIVETTNFIISHPFAQSYGKSIADYIEESKTKIYKQFQFPVANWRTKCSVFLYDDLEKWHTLKTKATAYSDIGIDKDFVVDKKIYLLVTQDIWTDKLPHEVAHCSLAEFTKKTMLRCVDEGMACYVETKAKTNYYKDQCLKHPEKIDLTKLIDTKEYPEDKISFYSHSYALVNGLIDLKDMATFNKFLIQLSKNNDFVKSLKTIYDYNITALQNKVIARLK